MFSAAARSEQTLHGLNESASEKICQKFEQKMLRVPAPHRAELLTPVGD